MLDQLEEPLWGTNHGGAVGYDLDYGHVWRQLPEWMVELAESDEVRDRVGDPVPQEVLLWPLNAAALHLDEVEPQEPPQGDFNIEAWQQYIWARLTDQ